MFEAANSSANTRVCVALKLSEKTAEGFERHRHVDASEAIGENIHRAYMKLVLLSKFGQESQGIAQ
jgi:hypothetical protein